VGRRGRQPAGQVVFRLEGCSRKLGLDVSRLLQFQTMQHFPASKLDQLTAAERRRPAIGRGLRFPGRGAEMAGMSTKSREAIWGGQIMGAEIRAKGPAGRPAIARNG
jgi:hypothetical protein